MKDHFIYFVSPDIETKDYLFFYRGHPFTPVKIGVTQDIKDRMMSLQTGCFFPLQLLTLLGPFDKVQAYNIEKELHTYFEELNSSGEWFKFRNGTEKQYTNYNIYKRLLKLLEPKKVEKLLNINKRSKNLVKTILQKHNSEKYHYRDFIIKVKEANTNISDNDFWDLIDKDQGEEVLNLIIPESESLSREDKIDIACKILNKF
jgi:hypothetical protein